MNRDFYCEGIMRGAECKETKEERKTKGEKMKMKKYEEKRRQIAGVMALIIMVSSLLGNAVGMTAYAATGEYPYMMFASSGDEGAITLTTNNVGINGNVATNGSIVTSSQNVNINGTRTENLGNPEAYIGMPDIGEALEAAYFSANTEVLSEDYSLEDTNININTPLEGEGSIELTGNITLNAGVMAEEDLVFSGEVKNTGDVVIYSATGDVVIESTNVNVNGLIYAPHGEIRINSMNLNMNNVILIAEKITIEANGINGGKNQAMAAFIGEDYAVLGEGAGNGDEGEGGDNPSVSDNEGEGDDPSVSGNEGEEEGDDNPSVSENEGNVSDNETELDLTTDTDGDGVSDDVEELVGCDPNKTDSDDDGLTDYEELFVTNTDATNRTSVEAGVTDADADSDGDGISNREEMDAGANPLNTDTDRDGISDYDEKNTYGTGIALPDSDGDGIEDGEELALGLNPLNTNTNGVADNEYLIQQTVSPDSEVLEEVNTVENTYRFSLDGMAAGYIENMDIEESGFAGTVANDAISGMVVELEYDMPVQDMTLFFEIKEEYRDNTSGAYVELSEENAGIGRFTVFFWADAVNMLIPIETQYDYENHTVYAETNYLGTYCLMDRELWYEQLGISPEDNTAVMGAMAVLSESGEIVMSEVSSNADATVTDSRTGMTMINGEEKEVYFYNGHMYTIYEGPASWLEAREACENAGGYLATINTAEEQAFFEDVILATDVAQRYWIGGYSEGYPYDFAWVTGEEFSYTNWSNGEPNFRNEYYTEIYGHFNDWYGYWNNHPNVSATRAYICEWESVDYTEDGVLLYCGLTMTALPEDFGVIRQGSTRDYDGDALLDLDEIYVEHELFEGPNESGIYECPTLGEVWDYAYEMYNFNRPLQLGLGNEYENMLNIPVVICYSNPLEEDTDGDGIIDGSLSDEFHETDDNVMRRDTAPLQRGLLNGIVGELSLVSATEGMGHTFMIYHSYIIDELDTSDFYYMYVYDFNAESWQGRNSTDYQIVCEEYISLGVSGDAENEKLNIICDYVFSGGLTLIDGNFATVIPGIIAMGNNEIRGGAFINRELMRVDEEPANYRENCSISREVTEEQINSIIEYFNEYNTYIFLQNNCAEVAVGAWNEVFNEDFSGTICDVMAPTEVASAISEFSDEEMDLESIRTGRK